MFKNKNEKSKKSNINEYKAIDDHIKLTESLLNVYDNLSKSKKDIENVEEKIQTEMRLLENEIKLKEETANKLKTIDLINTTFKDPIQILNIENTIIQLQEENGNEMLVKQLTNNLQEINDIQENMRSNQSTQELNQLSEKTESMRKQLIESQIILLNMIPSPSEKANDEIKNLVMKIEKNNIEKEIVKEIIKDIMDIQDKLKGTTGDNSVLEKYIQERKEEIERKINEIESDKNYLQIKNKKTKRSDEEKEILEINKFRLKLLNERLNINEESIGRLNSFKNRLSVLEKSMEANLLDSQIEIQRQDLSKKSNTSKMLSNTNATLGIQVNNLARYIEKLSKNLSNIEKKTPNLFRIDGLYEEEQIPEAQLNPMPKSET